MRELIPAAVALAARPMPHCADPAGLYAKLIDRIYAAGHNARSAKGLTSLRRAAAPLRSVKAIERQLTAKPPSRRRDGPAEPPEGTVYRPGEKPGLQAYAVMGPGMTLRRRDGISDYAPPRRSGVHRARVYDRYWG